MAQYALKNGVKRAALIVNRSDAYSTSLARFTEAAFTSGGGQIVAQETAGSGDTDFRAQLTRIGRANPEVLFIPWTLREVALIAKQARELGLKFQFYGYDGWDSLELPSLAEGALEGALFGSRIGFNTPEAYAYGEEYKARFNIALEAECLFTNDGLRWIVQVIKEKNSTDPTVIRDGLEATTSFSGLLGKMAVDPATHNPSRELAIFEIKGDKEVLKEIFN
jgi:branched-chain amino acid transport system substrate-binding protein